MSSPFRTRWPGSGTAGSLALEFVNTLDWRGRPDPDERLRGYDDLLHWAHDARVIDGREARTLLAWSAGHPRLAQRMLEAAIGLREAMAAVFQAVARGGPLPAGPLARLDAAAREARAARTLLPRERGAAWAWREGAPLAERPLQAAALDAAGLLTSAETSRVRECGDPQCAWMFLDTSRNRTRRWCSMESCGNRNKARRFHKKVAGRSGEGGPR